MNKNSVQLVVGAISLIALLAYTLVHTGSLLARYIEPSFVGYIAAFGIELSVAGLSLRIGELRRSKQKAGFFVFVLVAVVFVSALANVAEGFATQQEQAMTLANISQLDPIQAIVGLAATGLISLIVLALSEIIGTDISLIAKQAELDRKKLEREQAKAQDEAEQEQADEETQRFICEDCGREFGTVQALNAHGRVHSPSSSNGKVKADVV